MLNVVQYDHATITQVLQERRVVTTVTLPAGQRQVRMISLCLLEDGFPTVNAWSDRNG